MLQVKQISKKFNEQLALKEINLSFETGSTTVIVGPSGSGKSTLLRCLNLLEIPENGTLSLGASYFDFTKELKQKDVLVLRRKTGMVFQGFHLFPHLTILKNVMEGPVYVRKESKVTAENKARALLKKVGLAEKVDRYPDELSGGQQQRAAIARALAMNPEFLLFDEPTSALDPELEAEVLSVLRRLVEEGNSLIIVTHNLAFAREVADRILFLENGEILFEGTPELFFQGSGSKRIEGFISAMLPNK